VADPRTGDHPVISRQDNSTAESAPPLHLADVSPSFLTAIPRDFARRHLIISQGLDGDTQRLAVAESTTAACIYNTGVRMRSPVTPFVADGEAIARLVDEAYGAAGVEVGDDALDELDRSGRDIDDLLEHADRDLLSTQGKAPVVKLVDGLLFEALGHNASDVHVQPLSDRTLVRFRLDGVLHTTRELSREITPAVVSRIKVMGRMDIAERRIPQDGRATVRIGDRPIDLRISTMPTSYGERVVLRLLDNSQQLCDFDQIGMSPDVASRFLLCAQLAHGMILVTGPTGSGKTTTLYSTLRRMGSSEVNIMTIEDPIEYDLSTVGLTVSQSQINTRKGLTFATGLRHILRQDPDVIMVGEIRDAETARIAVQSSLTGHLVFSTLHTNDAASAVIRLLDLGVEPYLASASLSAVLAQRLVRCLHDECRGEGCEDCMGTGYHGRTGIFELLTVDDTIRSLITSGRPLAEIRQAARANGLRTLAEEGIRLREAGVTSRLEIRRVVEGLV